MKYPIEKFLSAVALSDKNTELLKPRASYPEILIIIIIIIVLIIRLGVDRVKHWSSVRISLRLG